MGESLAQIVAKLPEAEREKVLADINAEGLVWDWNFWLAPNNLRLKVTGLSGYCLLVVVSERLVLLLSG